VFDVAVVGLGAMGSAAAWQAAKRGARVVGFDRFAPPHAMGSSHGDTRITRLAIGEGEHYTPLVLRANDIWREIEQATGQSLHVVTGGLIISGPRRGATTHVANFFENTLAAARRFGIAHEVLDARAIRSRFPQFGVRDDEVAYFEPGAGYLRPERCIAAQLQLAGERGAQLRLDEPVESIEDRGDRVRITTSRGDYEARQAILAMGAWLPPFLGEEGRDLAVTRQVLYWFEPTASIEAFEAPRFPVWIWELQGAKHVIYGFPAIDGAGGGVKLATEQYAVATTPEALQREVRPAEIEAMYRDLVAPHLPGLGPRCVKAVACMYTATPDFQFRIGRDPRRGNLTVVSACSGHGFKHSAAIGERAAALALRTFKPA
jgi:sarcosine oxidase